MCDTFVALPPQTADGSTILGKNSDREPNEAQLLTWIPPRTYSADETVTCTYLTIPQVTETRGILLSRPFWLWGAEMGTNDAGVAIGNEAVFTREPQAKKKKLLGMDMLRLALERSGTAEQALETIIALLHDYGQGGPCGFEDTLYYHNSFLIADPETAWVLETAGEFWAAKQVKESYAISNGLTIGTNFDRSHPDLISHARKKGWLKKGQTFDFAGCYSDWFYTTFSGSRRRRSCSLSHLQKPLSVGAAMIALQDHNDDQYSPSRHLFMHKVCAHAAYPITRHAVQSTGSMVAHLSQDPVVWVTGTSAPCTSLYKPIWPLDPYSPDSADKGEGTYSATSLWWQHERLHRAILEDYIPRLNRIKAERDQWQETCIREARSLPSHQRRFFTQQTFTTATEQESEWLDKIRQTPPQNKPNRFYRSYWKKQNEKANLP